MSRFFATHVYEIAWWSLILILDGLIRLSRGRSPLTRAPFRFLLLSLWSVAFWFFFELINLRIENWRYIFVSPGEGERWLGIFLAFATVLPAITLSAELLSPAAAGSAAGRRRRAIPRWLLSWIPALGVACLVLPIIWPRYFYPLVWGGLVFILDPLNRRLGVRSLLSEWEEGRWGIFAAYLAAGALCGLLWELLNFWARVKWIYTVPFFEELKLFEMPFLGFLGFPPFALECWVFVQSLEGFGLLPRTGEAVSGRGIRRRVIRLAAALAASSIAAGMALPAMDRSTFASLYPLVEDLPGLSPLDRADLRARGIEDCFDLRAALDRQGDGSPALRRRVDLVLLAGIGIKDAAALEEIGVDSVAALARADPAEISRKLGALDLYHRPRPAEVRYWVRKARARADASAGGGAGASAGS